MKTQQSDLKKFEILYELYENEMFRICLSILKNFHLSEDALHESFLKLMRHRDKIGDPSSNKCRHFVIVTTKNTAIDMYRKHKKENNFIKDFPENDVSDASADFSDVEGIDFSKWNILRSLDIKYRTVIEYICIDGLTVKECAAVLMESESCVRKRLERGKKLLKEKLKNHAGKGDHNE